MMYRFIFLILTCLQFARYNTVAQTPQAPPAFNLLVKSTLIADGAELKLISRQFSFTEGPAVDKNGNVFFTDQPNNTIWKYSTDGKITLFLNKAGRSNGMYFDADGNLITCADEDNQLWSIDPQGKISVLLKDLNGLHFNGPNDLWIAPNGDIYFTDPYYQRAYWKRTTPEIPAQNVYIFRKGRPPLAVADNLMQPNGIIGLPDGQYLYVADIKADKTYRYKIATNGMLTEQTLFAPKGSDGMTMDEQGNIYLTGDGVWIYNSIGELIEHLKVPEDWTANVTFGGKDRNELFVTASKGVYVVKMKVRGAKWSSTWSK